MTQNNKNKYNKGFTLLEILLVIAAIGILAAIVIVAINPQRQLEQVRDAERQQSSLTLHRAVMQYYLDNFEYPEDITEEERQVCPTGSLSVEDELGEIDCEGLVDLRVLVPTYLAAIPSETTVEGNSGYSMFLNPENGEPAVRNTETMGDSVIGINLPEPVPDPFDELEPGTLWGWGGNWAGQVGENNLASNQLSPAFIGGDEDWVHIAPGVSETYMIKQDKTLWRIGGGSGTPTQVGSDNDWVYISLPSVSTGQMHRLALKSDGTLWSWGSNSHGQLGLGDTDGRSTPTQVGTDTWKTVSAGNEFSLGIQTDGSLWSWGRNQNIYNQLGQDSIGDLNVLDPTLVNNSEDWKIVNTGRRRGIAITEAGKLYSWGEEPLIPNPSNPTLTLGSQDWITADAGQGFAIALREDGTLWSWGQGSDRRLGTGNTSSIGVPAIQAGSDSDWVDVSLGSHHVVARKADGSIWAWGRNDAGQAGQGTSNTGGVNPIQIGTETNWVMARAGHYHVIAIQDIE